MIWKVIEILAISATIGGITTALLIAAFSDPLSPLVSDGMVVAFFGLVTFGITTWVDAFIKYLSRC